MNKNQAQALIQSTFETAFHEGGYTRFLRELFNGQMDESDDRKFDLYGQYIPDAFKEHVRRYKRLGTYTDPNGNEIDLLWVILKREASLEQARTMQRNFAAYHLKRRDKETAIIAYTTDDQTDWRFSMVRRESVVMFNDKGTLSTKEELTPVRRYSFLVGKNERSHTAQQQLLSILLENEHNPTLDGLEAAFNIETVTKEFFDRYKKLFLDLHEEIEGLITKNSTLQAEFEAKKIDSANFAKKLLGQIVFLYFLQKKGWLGVRKGENWGTGPKNFLRQLFDRQNISYDNFFNDVLEPLFYEALAIERPDNTYERLNVRIPFLNGGLFEPMNNYEWKKVDILIDNKQFKAIFDTFDLYNFTVREDEPLEKEVAVDPEMLGKVFENLLDVTDRKSKGAFYTPREIVHYMCQESLINYLSTAMGDALPREDLATFIRVGELAVQNDTAKEAGTVSYTYQMPESIRTHATKLDEALANIKICDPAIGSGAFPVGMMQEIIKAREVLTTYIGESESRTTYNFKRQAIQESIYGVDIDPGAIDIAKLRLWLSLVVDEDDYHDIKPLPNLDYKIVCGNSLLSVQKDLFNLDLFQQLEKLKTAYFDETNPQEKQEQRAEIDALIARLTGSHRLFDMEIYFSEVFHNGNGFNIVIANPPYIGEKGNENIFHEIKDTTLGKRFYSRWMDYFYYFFHKGLDISKQGACIAFITTNYYLTATGGIKLRKDIRQRTIVRNLLNFNELRIFESATGQHNMLTILQRGEPSDELSLNFITNNGGNANPELLASMFYGNDANTNYHSVPQSSLFEGSDFQIRISGQGINKGISIEAILSKMISKSYRLGDICHVLMGLASRADKVSNRHFEVDPNLRAKKGDGIFVLTTQEIKTLGLSEEDFREYVRPFYKNSDVSRYYSSVKNKLWVLYMKDTGEPIILNKELKEHFAKYEILLTKLKENFLKNKIAAGFVERWLSNGNYFVLFNPKEEEYFTQPKIIAPYRSKVNAFAYNEIPWFASQDVCYILSQNPEFELKYVLAILNSKLCFQWLHYKGKRKGEVMELYRKPVSEIPIKRVSEDKQKPFIDRVDKILLEKNSKAKADTSAIEREIDLMVYDLYGLTQEEISIVEKLSTDKH